MAAAWVAIGVVLGAFVTWLLTADAGARQRNLADQWRSEAVRAWREVDRLIAQQARLRQEQRSAGRREELAAVLADEPGARPVEAFAVTPGADQPPWMPDDAHVAYMETVAAEADEA